MGDEKLKQSFTLLESALEDLSTESDNPLKYAASSKAFEVCFEYCWKAMKREASKSGLEVYSPRDSIKAMEKLGRIDKAESWLEFLNLRNLSVHDYIGANKKTATEGFARFLAEAKEFYKDYC